MMWYQQNPPMGQRSSVTQLKAKKAQGNGIIASVNIRSWGFLRFLKEKATGLPAKQVTGGKSAFLCNGLVKLNVSILICVLFHRKGRRSPPPCWFAITFPSSAL